MPDENKIPMKDFGKNSDGKNYKNPQANWQTVLVVETWDDIRSREDQNDYYFLGFVCPNCKYNVDIGVLCGYERPLKFMCDNCHTLQTLPENFERKTIPEERRWSPANRYDPDDD